MRSFWRLPVKRQFLFANLLLVVPLIGLVLWSGWATLRERKDELSARARAAASTVAGALNLELQSFDFVAARLVADPALHGFDPALARGRLTDAVSGRPDIPAVVLVDREGHEVARAGSLTESLEADVWTAEVERRAGRVLVPVGGRGSNSLKFVVLAYPLKRADGTSGALGLVIQSRALARAYSSLDLPPKSLVSIAGGDGRILLQNFDVEPAEAFLGGAPRGEPRPAEPGIRADADGVTRQHAEAIAASGPWLVGVGMPADLALDSAMAIWTRNFTILIVGLVGWAVFTWAFSRRLTQSISHLDAAAQRIAAGDFSLMRAEPMLSAEFSQLQTAFDGMLRRFNATRSALDSQMAEERRIRQALESLQGQVIRQERLAAVGQLVSGVAHEINNPLQAILGFAELLQMHPEVPESVKSDLSLIQKESARACGIIRNLALFARQQPAEAAPVTMSEVIRAVAELRQRRLATEDIELQIEDMATQPVVAVLTELQQVVLNFVVNAEQAILSSGRLPGRIAIRSYDRENRLILEVEDTGPGIPPEHEAKLFQPFFTTKPVGQGTGLGLSISYGIIESLGGVIGYRRAPAGGAIFYCDLPAGVPSEV
jgi:signal transduction histidine kinase